MLKSIVSAIPIEPFESRMAWRSEPAPVSAVVVTVYVAACTAGAVSRAATIDAPTRRPRLGAPDPRNAAVAGRSSMPTATQIVTIQTSIQGKLAPAYPVAGVAWRPTDAQWW